MSPRIPMTSSTPRPDASLGDLLSARARATPASRLGIDIAGGALIAGAAFWARPIAWVVLASAASCLMFYGVWAIADRRLQREWWLETPGATAGWRLVRAIAGVLGLFAFGALLLAALGIALGRMIS